MNVVFMGTPDFSVPTLEMLINEGHTISAVVTQPDRQRGRGKKITMSPVKEVALKHGLTVLQPERVKGNDEFLGHIQSLNPDVIVVIAFGQILPESILNIPRYGCINVHGSLLPEYRGAAPIQWSVLNEDKETGVTIMYMDKGMDTGDMIYKKKMDIAPDETYESLYEKMKVVGSEALRECWDNIVSGNVNREPQDDAKATYAPPIQKSQGLIDWTKPAHVINAQVRGLTPWPGGYTSYNDEVMKVWKTTVVESDKNNECGKVLEVSKKGILVQTGENALLLEEIQMPNKKRMPVMEYIKGHTIESGIVLGV